MRRMDWLSPNGSEYIRCMLRLVAFSMLVALISASGQIVVTQAHLTRNISTNVSDVPATPLNTTYGSANLSGNVVSLPTNGTSLALSNLDPAVRGRGASLSDQVVTAAYDSSVNGFTGTLAVTTSLTWTSTTAEIPNLSFSSQLLMEFNSSSDFSYALTITSSGILANAGLSQSWSNQVYVDNLGNSSVNGSHPPPASALFSITDLTTSQVLASGNSFLSGAAFAGTLAGGSYRLLLVNAWDPVLAAGQIGTLGSNYSGAFALTAIPEPASYAVLLGLGIFGLVAKRRR